MKVDSECPVFQVRCVKCNAEPGYSCGSWEGAPVFCLEREKIADELFGKHKYKNGKYVRV
jgi:hypothetical protein